MYHGVLLWNEIAVDWLSMTMWFGKFSSLDARMGTRGYVHCLWLKPRGFGYPIFVTRN